MRISWTIVLVAVLIAATGCQEKAGIRIEDKTVDSVNTPGAVSAGGGPEVSVVTGEPVVVSAKGKRADGATAEDKTGGVAVKVQY